MTLTIFSDLCLLHQSILPKSFELSNASEQQRVTKRTLRRGEFGHDPKDIERYEQMGFVMSGNRRKKHSTDEASKKGDFTSQKEERALREMELVARFKEMIEERKGPKQK